MEAAWHDMQYLERLAYQIQSKRVTASPSHTGFILVTHHVLSNKDFAKSFK